MKVAAAGEKDLDCDHQRHAGLYGAQRVKAMSAVLLGLLLSVLDYAIANVALPSIAHDLNAPSSRAIWVVNAYQLANLSCLLPLASFGSRVGFARMSQIGISCFSSRLSAAPCPRTCWN